MKELCIDASVVAKRAHPEVFPDKLELLRAVLALSDLRGKRVLDAGTGRTSARALLEKHPSEIVLVAAPGDERKAEPAREALAQFPDAMGDVILGNLSDSGLFPPDSFDFTLADYLIGEIDCFAPSMHFLVLSNIHSWLRPGGELVIVDIEPAQDESETLSAVRELMFWAQTANMLARRWRERPRDYPSRLVLIWLRAIGFAGVRTDYYERRLDVGDADSIHRMALERLSGLRNDSLREGLKRELDTALAEIDRLPPSQRNSMTQTNYVIRALK
ncbi:MAG: hypothetical protein JW759_02205 [Candidatus Coatesbacteria bacterium]|nr:hypothetical protein [Candidatus Coatesbacteria bacterium]